MRAILEKIKQKPESHKRAISLGLSLVVTFLIVLGWAGQKGVWGGSHNTAKTGNENKNQVASVVEPPSPLQSSTRSIMAGAEEIKRSYQAFKESLSNVLVPFITGIEVYEKK